MIDIPKSRLGCTADEFAAALLAHRKALEDHATGEEGVAAPVADELLHALILRVPDSNPIIAARKPDRFVIQDYRIVEPTLAERKETLLGQLQTAAAAARAALLSPARQQLLQLDANAALAIPEAQRTPDQGAAIAGLHALNDKTMAIARTTALAAVEIEDLTADTVASWKAPAF